MARAARSEDKQVADISSVSLKTFDGVNLELFEWRTAQLPEKGEEFVGAWGEKWKKVEIPRKRGLGLYFFYFL